MWGYDFVAVWVTLAVLGLSTPDTDQAAAEAAGCFLERGYYVLGLRDEEWSDHQVSLDWQVEMYRYRFQETRDAPPLSDAARFPPREVCQDYMRLNQAYCKRLKAAWELDLAFRPELAAAQVEAEELWAVWSAAEDVNAGVWMHRWARRLALKDLRRRLGDYDYWLGRMPPPVPLHHFSRLDP